MEGKTHWKKNLDSKFIAGEDLQNSLHGLKPEMVVVIEKFNDAETFDQNKAAKTVVTGLFLREVGGKPIYKPAVLNKTNAKVLVKEFGSEMMEDWLNKPICIYAQKDSRHGYVVRFKKYVKPTLTADSEAFKKAKTAIDSGSYTLDQIKTKYNVPADIEQLLIAK